jgi:hypothetical protein
MLNVGRCIIKRGEGARTESSHFDQHSNLFDNHIGRQWQRGSQIRFPTANGSKSAHRSFGPHLRHVTLVRRSLLPGDANLHQR